MVNTIEIRVRYRKKRRWQVLQMLTGQSTPLKKGTDFSLEIQTNQCIFELLRRVNCTDKLLKNLTKIEENKYLTALKNGDAKSFDKLFTEYGKRLYHFSYGYLKSAEKAEDVVQEVFLRIWRNRHQLNPNLSFKAYVFKIAYHYILELFEQNNRQQDYQHQLLEESIIFNDDANERLNYQMLLEKVEALIEKLPERQRQVLLKRKKEGISITEIASQLNIAPKTVENHLTEALKNIKKGLEKEEISELLFFFILHNHLN